MRDKLRLAIQLHTFDYVFRAIASGQQIFERETKPEFITIDNGHTKTTYEKTIQGHEIIWRSNSLLHTAGRSGDLSIFQLLFLKAQADLNLTQSQL